MPNEFYFFLFFEVDFTDGYLSMWLAGLEDCDLTSSYFMKGGRKSIFKPIYYLNFTY